MQPTGTLARAAKSMGWAALTRIAVLPVTAAAILFNTNIIVTSAGAEKFGQIMLISSLFMLFPFADLGLGAVITSHIAARSTMGDVKAQRVVRKCMKILLLSASILGALVILGSLFGVWGQLLGLPPAQASVANIAVPAAILPFAFSLPLGVGQRILIGLSRTHFSNLVGIVGPIASVVLTILLVRINAEPLYLAVATPLGVFFVALVSFFLSMRLTGWRIREVILAAVPDKNGPSQISVWDTAIPMLIISVMVPVALQSHRLIISHLRPDDLPEYSIAAQLYAPCYGIIATVAVSLWPIFTQQGKQGRKLWSGALLIMIVVGVTAFLGYAWVAPLVANFVSGDAIPISPELALAFGVLLIVMAAHQPSAMLLTSPPQLLFQAKTTVCMFIFAVGGSLYLTPLIGASAPVWSYALAVAICQLLPCLIYANRYFKES